MGEHYWIKVGRFWRWEFYRCKACKVYAAVPRGTVAKGLQEPDCPVASGPTGTDLV